ncbi:MAG TPA: hypothetical protein VIU87_00305, partial [Mycobacterium sp.]
QRKSAGGEAPPVRPVPLECSVGPRGEKSDLPVRRIMDPWSGWWCRGRILDENDPHAAAPSAM